MNNKIVLHLGLIALLLNSFNCLSNDNWSDKQAYMSCGTSSVKLSAECKIVSNNSTYNICKGYQVEIKNDEVKKVLRLPYMPDEQKELLESQGYSFNDVVKPGDWFPDMMNCYNDKIIVIGYRLGLIEEEEVNGSLLSYIDAPFFDLSGRFLSGSLVKDLRSKEIKDPYNNTKINFITIR